MGVRQIDTPKLAQIDTTEIGKSYGKSFKKWPPKFVKHRLDPVCSKISQTISANRVG